MIVCVPVSQDGSIDPRWGRAARVAVADVRNGAIVSWEEVAVGWDALHDVHTGGGHHSRVATFLTSRGVELVVAYHMGDPMQRMLREMGIRVSLGASGNAPGAALAVVTKLTRLA